MKSIKRERNWYLFLSVAGIFAVAAAVFLFIDAYKAKDDFRIFMRGLIAIFFVGLEVSYIRKYNKLSRTTD